MVVEFYNHPSGVAYFSKTRDIKWSSLFRERCPYTRNINIDRLFDRLACKLQKHDQLFIERFRAPDIVF